MPVNDIGIIGMGVMGKALALSLSNRKYNVAVYDEKKESAVDFATNDRAFIKSYTDVKSFIYSLAKPRKIFLMTPYQAAEDMINQIEIFLQNADVIIDGTDSYYLDTKARYQRLKSKGIRLLDVSFAGAKQGMSTGVGITAGGDDDTFGSCSRILRQISKDYKGYNCCIHLGQSGAGHFTKMVHDAAEYALMQIIAESYDILRRLDNMSCEEISATFNFLSENNYSYLLDITSLILEKSDGDTGKPIIDLILDSSRNKSGGKAAIHEAIELKIPFGVSSSALFARYQSAEREKRRLSVKTLLVPKAKYQGEKYQLVDDVRDAMYASMIITYAQAIDLLKSAYQLENWNAGVAQILSVWCGSSTINSNLLSKARDAHSDNMDESLINSEYFSKSLKSEQKGWRETVSIAVKHAIPIPTIMSALSYYDGMCSNILPTNLIQAQRNYLGKDTVKRYDKQGNFDISWPEKSK